LISRYGLINIVYKKEKIPSSTTKYILNKLQEKDLISANKELVLTEQGEFILKLFEKRLSVDKII